ncbi:hypothetical protein N0V90_010943 [Kalmusia sp. IMI 367209]|nr:hypothetical protein N0V90_010943 [Kalmusia sp. IMI 367209]
MANTPPHKVPPKQIPVSSLLSPPEMKRSESFGSSAAPSIATTSFSSFGMEQSKPAMAPWLAEGALTTRDATLTYASPPISPYDSQSQKEHMDRMDVDGVRDPQLFIRSDTASSIAPDEPLFPQEQVDPAAQELITKHMQSINFAALESKPTREEYELAVSFVSNVHDLYNKDPRAWFQREREFDKQYSRPTIRVHKREPLKKLAPAPSARPSSKPKIALPRLPRSPRAPRAPKRTPKAQVFDSFDNAGPSESPKPARPTGTRDDTDYNSLPDYSPPLDTLDKGNSSALKTEWKGSALKLHNDPDRHLLHEAEIPLAGTLRLSCATYLCSKRRIFQARIEALKIGKEFRKTDAQQACKIDVNKASKLWSVYDKVGWFDPKHFARYV